MRLGLWSESKGRKVWYLITENGEENEVRWKLETLNFKLHLTLRLAPRTGLRVSCECLPVAKLAISCTGKHHYYNAVIQLLLSDEKI